ncbi:UvrD-helicase domain-containing protein [Streptomyces sp. 303MFCol5.2]|uniref:UvrD-helicase domain-containing protein n=1 Tax=Streptomyces sp. 303MFCol5.2 TaxID=1172181 RepID=UPI0003A55F81|nr:UvrD-helicase domain-containing protein [Streptomyces sp. 303MFCol5.2]
MTLSVSSPTTAEQESADTLRRVLTALDERSHFKMEAGAGAGKTYSLIDTLRHILTNRGDYLPRDGQRVACITYTNVARNEIIRRTDGSPYVFAETIHGFLWENISRFRKTLIQEIKNLPGWERRLAELGSLEGYNVSYDLGFRNINDVTLSLHHEDIPELAGRLFKKPKFRKLVADRFPVILVDEYQDTPAGLAEAMLGMDPGTPTPRAPVYGFFGDHWQQIYEKTCGVIDHESVQLIQKRANWRSSKSVVALLNAMRPELPQAAVTEAEEGSVTVYHTNDWSGPRGTHSKKGQLPEHVLKETRKWVQERTRRHRGESACEMPPKILMLTHSSIASELGFGGIDRAFKYNDDYVRKSDDVVSFLLDVIEPCCEYFNNKQYGPMFDLLKRSRPRMRTRNDKNGWADLFGKLETARSSENVGTVIDILLTQQYFAVPQAVVGRERKWKLAIEALGEGEELSEPRRLMEYGKFREVSYREVIALRDYVEENTPFSTQHGVKGAEYPTVIAVFGGGWSQYNFPEMLAKFSRRASFVAAEKKRYERSRNLFYVACSRAQEHLVMLFTTELSDDSLQTLRDWVGETNIVSIRYSPDGAPTSS